MIVAIRVVPNARRNVVEEQEQLLKVYISAPALEGKANKAIIPLLAKHYGVAKSKIEIIKGLKSRNKTINIDV